MKIEIIIYEENGNWKRYPIISKKDAIKKMAKAAFARMWQNKYSWEDLEEEDKKSFYKSAEAELNALLEDGICK